MRAKKLCCFDCGFCGRLRGSQLEAWIFIVMVGAAAVKIAKSKLSSYSVNIFSLN